MKPLNENGFHWLMGALLLGSCYFDPFMRWLLPTWNPPQPSLATTVIGLIWVGRYCAWRLELTEEKRRTIKHRIEHLETQTNAIEDEMRRRSDPFRR